jgi:tetratricopeptide (TPR) repeat protein
MEKAPSTYIWPTYVLVAANRWFFSLAIQASIFSEAPENQQLSNPAFYINFGPRSIMAEKRKKQAAQSKAKKKKTLAGDYPSMPNWKYILPILGITFLLFIPALSNGFTNWDDVLYVTNNSLLKNLNGEGLKAIFSTPVVSNYHPLTILSLALNYQFAELNPMTYHLTSIILHVINTGLVFWFIWVLSGGNKWVSVFVALLFGIHPMHVESVAWISERKDLLYTLFYVSAMIVYVRYVQLKQIKHLALVTVLGGLSLLCKPAAIVLPLSLIAIDYYLKREWSWKWVIEKMPLFILAAGFAFATLSIQSERAVASVDLHSIGDRISFAGFGLIWYLVKLIAPFGLSALHPFPSGISMVYYLFTALSVAGIILLALKVRNRNIIFGFGFYVINLILVLQLISIGNAVVAERYTYVPYIGIFFMLGMEASLLLEGHLSKFKKPVLALTAAWILLLCFLTWNRVSVWKDSQTLWADVLTHYPESTRAWTNKGLNLYDQKMWPEVIEHFNEALAIDPNYADALEWRSRAYLENKEENKALKDAQKFYALYPQKEAGLFLVARAQDATKDFAGAVNSYSALIQKYPNKPEYYNNRGVLYFNKLKQYENAKSDFNQAIQISPQNGSYYMNLSRCYYMMGNSGDAQKNALRARELGETIDPSYGNLIGIQ